MEVDEAIEAAIHAGLGGVVLTEHNYLRRDNADLSAIAAGRVTVLVGMEINCAEGHFLVFGLPDDSGLSYEMPVRILLELAADAGAAVAAAHPYRWNEAQGVACFSLALDAVEIASNNTSDEAGRKARRLASAIGATTIECSDAHAPEVVGRWWTELPDGIVTIGQVAEALKARSHPANPLFV